MSPEIGFITFLVTTVLLLVIDVISGMRGTLKLHIPSVLLTVVSLGLAIFYAERLGQLYDVRAAGTITPIHLTLAKITTAAYLLPVVTGLRTLKDRRNRTAHRKVAFLVLTMTVLTAGTGLMMILNAPRLDEGAAESQAGQVEPGHEGRPSRTG